MNIPDGFEILEIIDKESFYKYTPLDVEFGLIILSWEDKQKKSKFIIKSVLRKSDKMIFNIGTDLYMDPDKRPIGKLTSIWILNGQMRGDINNLGVVLHRKFITSDIIQEKNVLKYLKDFISKSKDETSLPSEADVVEIKNQISDILSEIKDMYYEFRIEHEFTKRLINPNGSVSFHDKEYLEVNVLIQSETTYPLPLYIFDTQFDLHDNKKITKEDIKNDLMPSIKMLKSYIENELNGKFDFEFSTGRIFIFIKIGL